MLLQRVTSWLSPLAAVRMLVTALLLSVVVCAAPVQLRAQDVGDLLDTLGDDAPLRIVDLLANEAVLADLQLNNSQRERVAEIASKWRQQDDELTERHETELAAVSDAGERIRLRAAHLRETRELSAQWRNEAVADLSETLSEEQLARLKEKLAAADAESAPGAGATTEGTSPSSTAPAQRTKDTVESFSADSTDNTTSNTAAAGTRSTEPPAGESTNEKVRVAFNFFEAPWTDVLRLFADAAGLTLHVRETPPGLFTYYDRNSYTPSEALDVMNRYLLQDGFILIRHDRFLTVLDATKGVPPNLVETVESAALDSRGATEMLRVSLPLGDRDASAAAEEIRGLLGPQGTVVPLASAGSVVVTDIAANLRRVRQLLEPPPVVADAEMTFRSFPLVHVDAEVAADTVRKLFGVATGMTNVSAGAGGDSGGSRESRRGPPGFDPERFRRFMESRGGGGDDDRGRDGSSGTPQTPPNSTKVTVDRRTNSVLVTAKAEDMKLVTQVIDAIDVPPGETTAFDRGGTASEPYLEVYELESADPQETAKTLSVLHPGLVVNEDGRAHRIHVWATAAEQREVAMHIRQLDGAATGESLAVIPLQGMNAVDVSTTLTSLYASDPQGAPSIAYDPSGRGLIVRGNASQVMQIRMLIGQLALQEPVESRRTIRIVPTGTPSGQYLQQAISALYPQITVISTPEVASQATSGSSNDRRRSADRSQEDREREERFERIRQFWRDRFFGGGDDDSSRDRGPRPDRGGGDRRGGRGR